MGNKLVILKDNNRIISSFFEGDELVQISVEPVGTDSILGNIYLGKVKNILKNINAAFVEIEEGRMCYYSLTENENPLFCNKKNNNKVKIGDEIIVQVVKEDVKTKAPVATSNLNLTGKYIVLTRGNTKLSVSSKILDEKEKKRLKEILGPYSNQEFGFIIRTNAANQAAEMIEKEVQRLIVRYNNMKEFGVHKYRFSLLYKEPAGYLCAIRDGYADELDWITTDDRELYKEMVVFLSEHQDEDLHKLKLYEDSSFPLNKLYGIQTKLEKALLKKIWLKSGGYLVLEPTEALTVIDVNTGKAIKGKKPAQETFQKINMEAATEIAKQIRLRNISGIIIIDFIDMAKEIHREKLMSYLKELFRKDPIPTVLVDMTALGLVEVTRKKVRKPLYEQVHFFD